VTAGSRLQPREQPPGPGEDMGQLGGGEQSRTSDGAARLARLDLLPQPLGLFVAVLQVRVHQLLDGDVGGDDGRDVGQLQRRVRLDDPCRPQPALNLTDDDVERDARLADAVAAALFNSGGGR
jgi:hypothetical protein